MENNQPTIIRELGRGPRTCDGCGKVKMEVIHFILGPAGSRIYLSLCRDCTFYSIGYMQSAWQEPGKEV